MPSYITQEKITEAINKFLKNTFIKYPPLEATEYKFDEMPEKVIENIEKAQISLNGLKNILTKRMDFYKLLKEIIESIESKKEIKDVRDFLDFYKSRIIKLKDLHIELVDEINKEKENLKLLKVTIDSMEIALNRGKFIEDVLDYSYIQKEGLLIKIGNALEENNPKKIDNLLKILLKNIK